MGSGGTIAEINAVRKHFSRCQRRPAGRGCSACGEILVVVGGRGGPRYLDALSSGMTLPDSSTVAECLEILHRYHLWPRLSPAVRAFFEDPQLPETPSLEGSSPMEILLSSDDLIDQARDMAERLGYEVVIDNTCDDWDYLDAARHLLGRFAELSSQHPKICLLSAGEVTVRLGHEHGAGGRNQQFALACALELPRPMVVLSAGSDGIDGHSPAAGAVVDATTVERSKALGLDPRFGARAVRCVSALHRPGRHADDRPHPQQPEGPADYAFRVKHRRYRRSKP